MKNGVLLSTIEGDTYPLPHIEDLLAKTAEARIFSKIDLVSGFHQIPVHVDDQKYLAFTAIDNSYTFKYVPFGLNIAPALFTRALNNALRQCQEFTSVYVDDILVFSLSVDQHMDHLTRVFRALGEANFRISMKKSTLGVTKIDYLGHILTPGRMEQDPRKKEAVSNFPVPLNAKGVRRFLGMAGYYRKFIRNFAKIAEPLMSLVSLKGTVVLDESQLKAFEALKRAMTEAPVLELFHSGRETRVEVDSCASGVGAVLSQVVFEAWKPVAFFSKKFPKTAKAYASRETEAFGIYLSIVHWRVWLLGRKFLVISDHKSLVLADHGRNSRRIQRWLLGLSEYRYEVKYRRGLLHSAPDALSRIWAEMNAPEQDPNSNDEDEGVEHVLAVDVKEPEFDEVPAETPEQLGLYLPDEADDDRGLPEVIPLEEYMTTLPGKQEWARATLRCPELAPIARVLAGELKDSVTARVQAQALIKKFELSLKDGIIVDGKGLKWVPEEYREVMCSLFHATPFSFHYDAKRTLTLLTRVATWPFVADHVKTHVASCLTCRIVKGKVTKPFLEIRDVEPIPFQAIAVDYAGPLPLTATKKRYILVAVDIFSGFPEAVAVARADGATTAKALLSIFSRHGYPKYIISDNGSTFKNKLLAELCRHTGVKQQFTTTRHPQSNGAAENLVKAIKRALKLDGLVLDPKDPEKDWDQRLEMVLFALRRAPRAPLWLSPAQIIYGRQIEGPLEQKLQEDEPVEYTPVKDWIFQRLQSYHETRLLLGEAQSAAREKRSEDRGGKLVKPLSPGSFVLTHHDKHLITDLRGAKFRWKGPYIVYKATSAVNYIVLVEGKPVMFHVSRLLPYDPTGVQVHSPLHLRLEQLKKELAAYQALVQAEIKSLQSRKKRLIPQQPLEVPKDDVVAPEVKVEDLDLGVHPEGADLHELKPQSTQLEEKMEPESKHAVLDSGGSRENESTGDETPAPRAVPSVVHGEAPPPAVKLGRYESRLTLDPKSTAADDEALPPTQVLPTTPVKVSPIITVPSGKDAAIKRAKEKQSSEELEQDHEGNFGVIRFNNKLYVAELKGDLAHLYQCDGKHSGTFYPVHENKKKKWVNPKTTSETSLWPVMVTQEQAEPVLPFYWALSRGKLSEQFREAAKSCLHQLS